MAHSSAASPLTRITSKNMWVYQCQITYQLHYINSNTPHHPPLFIFYMNAQRCILLQPTMGYRAGQVQATAAPPTK
eukprot:10222613-Ditylum_brightwellii.AAC.1